MGQSAEHHDQLWVNSKPAKKSKTQGGRVLSLQRCHIDCLFLTIQSALDSISLTNPLRRIGFNSMELLTGSNRHVIHFLLLNSNKETKK